MVYVQRHWATPTGMSIDELQETCSALMLGGSETTASALSGALYHLLKNPSCLDKVVKEIRSTFKNESEISLVSTNHLTYQAAVLEETLRIYPPRKPLRLRIDETPLTKCPSSTANPTCNSPRRQHYCRPLRSWRNQSRRHALGMLPLALQL
jgi:Cytochrome P450